MSKNNPLEIACYAVIDGSRICTDRLSDAERKMLSERGRIATGSAIGSYCLNNQSNIQLLISKEVIKIEKTEHDV